MLVFYTKYLTRLTRVWITILGVSVTCVTCINLILDFDGGFGRLIWNTFLFLYNLLILLGKRYLYFIIHTYIHSFITILFCLWEVFFCWDKRGLKYGSRLMIILGIRFFCFWYVVSSLRRWPLRERRRYQESLQYLTFYKGKKRSRKGKFKNQKSWLKVKV